MIIKLLEAGTPAKPNRSSIINKTRRVSTYKVPIYY